MSCSFKECVWNNCELTFDKTLGHASDAVIFNSFSFPTKLNFARPMGQVWIFTENESPWSYRMEKRPWYKKKYTFNWTMTYDADTTDIYLPYGEIRPNTIKFNRDYETLVEMKNRTPVMIASNCRTHSKRPAYVHELQKHIPISIFGVCGGGLWKCGKRYRHDDVCFQMLNKTFLLYLAFENAFCRNYFTEKFFENFNYDTIMITRGGLPGDSKRLFPEGTYISTDDFKSAKDLATYLRNLTTSDYVKMLKKKDQYYSTGYKPVHQRALCDICHRMNFQGKYNKTITDMRKWAFDSKPCLMMNNIKV